MNKKVFIRQDGTIPGRRIIEELERRGGIHANSYLGGGNCIFAYYYIAIDFVIDTLNEPPKGYTELLYNKETDSFYERTERMKAGEAKEALLTNAEKKILLEQDMSDSDYCKLVGIMTIEQQEHLRNFVKAVLQSVGHVNIPEGYEAKIEDGKVIVRKKKWEPKEFDIFWNVVFDRFHPTHGFFVDRCTLHGVKYEPKLNDFETEKEAQAFCDKLNDAISLIFEERRKEVGVCG